MNDNRGGVSCDSAACSSSGNTVPTINYRDFTTKQAELTVRSSNSPYTLNLGRYASLKLNSSMVLRMETGEYIINGAIELQYAAKLIVDSPSDVSIFIATDFNDPNWVCG